MFERYREFGAEAKRLFSHQEVQRDGDGRLLIEINLRDTSELFSPYAIREESQLSAELSEFLRSATFAQRPREALHLVFKSKPLSLEQQQELRRAVQATFSTAFIGNQIKRKRNLLTSLLLFLTSLVFLGLMALLSVKGVNAIAVEIVDIAGWVFMWEAVDEFFIERSLLRLKRRRYLNLITAPVDFVEL